MIGRSGLHFIGEQDVTSSLLRGVTKWLMGSVSSSFRSLTGMLVQHRGMALVGRTNSVLHERIAPASPLESARSPLLSSVLKKAVTAEASKLLSASSIRFLWISQISCMTWPMDLSTFICMMFNELEDNSFRTSSFCSPMFMVLRSFMDSFRVDFMHMKML